MEQERQHQDYGGGTYYNEANVSGIVPLNQMNNNSTIYDPVNTSQFVGDP
jgi:hypothetical protein